MEKKARIKLALTNVAINLSGFAFLFGIITLNKEFFRPNWGHLPVIGIITGSFPNFITAFLLSLAPLYSVLKLKPKFGAQIIYSVSFFVFSVMVIDELSSLLASKNYDLYDIIGTVLGSALAAITYKLIDLNQKKRASLV